MDAAPRRSSRRKRTTQPEPDVWSLPLASQIAAVEAAVAASQPQEQLVSLESRQKRTRAKGTAKAAQKPKPKPKPRAKPKPKPKPKPRAAPEPEPEPEMEPAPEPVPEPVPAPVPEPEPELEPEPEPELAPAPMPAPTPTPTPAAAGGGLEFESSDEESELAARLPALAPSLLPSSAAPSLAPSATPAGASAQLQHVSQTQHSPMVTQGVPETQARPPSPAWGDSSDDEGPPPPRNVQETPVHQQAAASPARSVAVVGATPSQLLASQESIGISPTQDPRRNAGGAVFVPESPMQSALAPEPRRPSPHPLPQRAEPTDAAPLFRTGTGKAVAISQAAMRRGAAVLAAAEGAQQGGGAAANPAPSSAAPEASAADETPAFITGSGRNIRISDEALLRRGEAVLASANGSDDPGSAPPLGAGSSQAPASMPMFQTGGGNRVVVSDTAMRKGAAFVASSEPVTQGSSAGGAQGDMPMFQSGTGRAIPISESAMRRGQSFVDADEMSSAGSGAAAAPLFQTGSGKVVKLTEEATRRAQAFLDSADGTSSGGDPHSQALQGMFQTGSGSAVPVSQAAMRRGAALLDDSGSDGGSSSTAAAASSMQGMFQTGGGKAVAISEEAMRKGLAVISDGSQGSSPSSSAGGGASSSSNLGQRPPASKGPLHDQDQNTRQAKRRRMSFKPPASTASLHARPSPGPAAAAAPLRLISGRWGNDDEVAPLDVLAQTYPYREDADVNVGTQRDVKIASITPANAVALGSELTGLTPTEARQQLLETGALKKLTTMDWVENHFALIVWKLASYERRYPELVAAQSGTARELSLSKYATHEQLVLRYDREIAKGERSVLRKMMDKDEPHSVPMILVVSAIRRSLGGQQLNAEDDDKALFRPSNKEAAGESKLIETEFAEATLSDGWWSVRVVLDRQMTEHVRTKKLRVGQKIFVVGAQLSPKASDSSMILQVHTNGASRAKAFAKLGKPRVHPDTFARPVKSLWIDGGQVCSIDIVIQRRYPIMFSERQDDGSEWGKRFLRDQRGEDEARRQHAIQIDDIRENAIDKVRRKMAKEEADKRRSRKMQHDVRITEDMDGAEIYAAVNSWGNPECAYQQLPDYQQEQFDRASREMQFNQRTEFEAAIDEEVVKAMPHLKGKEPGARQVSAFVQLLVTDAAYSGRGGTTTSDTCFVTVWNIDEDYVRHFAEGSHIRFYGLRPDARKFMRGRLRLNLSRPSNCQIVSDPRQVAPPAAFVPRQPLRTSELATYSLATDYDLCAVVLRTCQQHERTIGSNDDLCASEMVPAIVWATDSAGFVVEIRMELASGDESALDTAAWPHKCSGKECTVITLHDVRHEGWDDERGLFKANVCSFTQLQVKECALGRPPRAAGRHGLHEPAPDGMSAALEKWLARPDSASGLRLLDESLDSQLQMYPTERFTQRLQETAELHSEWTGELQLQVLATAAKRGLSQLLQSARPSVALHPAAAAGDAQAGASQSSDNAPGRAQTLREQAMARVDASNVAEFADYALATQLLPDDLATLVHQICLVVQQSLGEEGGAATACLDATTALMRSVSQAAASAARQGLRTSLRAVALATCKQRLCGAGGACPAVGVVSACAQLLAESVDAAAFGAEVPLDDGASFVRTFFGGRVLCELLAVAAAAEREEGGKRSLLLAVSMAPPAAARPTCRSFERLQQAQLIAAMLDELALPAKPDDNNEGEDDGGEGGEEAVEEEEERESNSQMLRRLCGGA